MSAFRLGEVGEGGEPGPGASVLKKESNEARVATGDAPTVVGV